MDIKKGETYCVKGGVGIGFFVGRPNLEIVDMDMCKKEIVETIILPRVLWLICIYKLTLLFLLISSTNNINAFEIIIASSLSNLIGFFISG